MRWSKENCTTIRFSVHLEYPGYIINKKLIMTNSDSEDHAIKESKAIHRDLMFAIVLTIVIFALFGAMYYYNNSSDFVADFSSKLLGGFIK